MSSNKLVLRSIKQNPFIVSVAAGALVLVNGCKWSTHDSRENSSAAATATPAPAAPATPASANTPPPAQTKSLPSTIRINGGGSALAYVETVPVDIAAGQLDIKFTPKIEHP